MFGLHRFNPVPALHARRETNIDGNRDPTSGGDDCGCHMLDHLPNSDGSLFFQKAKQAKPIHTSIAPADPACFLNSNF